jgi:hypothetical protein
MATGGPIGQFLSRGATVPQQNTGGADNNQAFVLLRKRKRNELRTAEYLEVSSFPVILPDGSWPTSRILQSSV